MSEILFGQSYFLRFDPKLWQAMQPYPPLGTLYAASYMRQRGCEAALFDAMLAESTDDWRRALEAHRPLYAVLFEDNFNYLSKMCLLRMRQAAYEMIALARERGCTVIVCGADATDHPAEYLAAGADFVLRGEGEVTLGELVDQLSGRTLEHLAETPGLAYRVPARAGESLVITSPRDDIRDLDSLPFPAWDLVDIERYRKIWLERHGYFSMNLATTRGCPFHCNWCAKPIWGQRYHSRSPENAAAEVAWLKEVYSPDHLWIVDDIFGLRPGWVQRFADLLEEKGVKIPFKCLNRVDLLLREGEIEALRRAGCHTAWVGAESGAQHILEAMDKGTRVEQIYEAARRLREAGIRVGFFLQFGYPGESWEDILKTMKMVWECRPDDIGMSVSYPLPGTRFHEAVKAQLGVQQNWIDSNDLAMLYQGPFSTAFYRQLHSVLHKEYRLRRTWWRLSGRQKGTSNPVRNEQRGSIMRAVAAACYHAVTLPLAWFRLRRLKSAPHRGVTSLPGLQHPLDASIPSAQREG